ncbi:hypothetical protein LCL95_16435 [Bacillus timonensis]|nr:hypothetical protein [Bacillus timonensis]
MGELSVKKARDFVLKNGTVWEKALFQYLFEDGSIKRVHQALLCYKNEDGGWGHGLEHDIQCPSSNPLALEFLLAVIRDTDIPVGNLLEGTVEWLEQNRKEDGSLKNPNDLLEYPHAPWWGEGGQTAPDSIVGNLMKHGLCSESLAASTANWVKTHLTEEKIKEVDWLFMAYHAFDYFMNAPTTEDNERGKQLTINHITSLVMKAEPKQYFTFFHFSPTPESPIAKAVPKEYLDKLLDHLCDSQREDGGWDDEHGLLYWQPYMTIKILHTLKNYNRI